MGVNGKVYPDILVFRKGVEYVSVHPNEHL
jgi:hypothetical protein